MQAILIREPDELFVYLVLLLVCHFLLVSVIIVQFLLSFFKLGSMRSLTNSDQ